MRPYRRHLVGLQLQRSTFRDLDIAQALCIEDWSPRLSAVAWLDANGDLFIDGSAVDELTDRLDADHQAERLVAVRHRLRSRCRTLLTVAHNAERAAPSAGVEEGLAHAAKVGQALAGVVPYGVLSKFLPDHYMRRLQAAGYEGPPPVPSPSPGGRLAADLAALAAQCRALGAPPVRLASIWPDVEPRIRAAVARFCRAHAGFGSLPWEVPAYEDPEYTVRRLADSFGDEHQARSKPKLRNVEGRRPRVRTPPGAERLRIHLALWLHFLELETWYVRRAFWRGLLPVLRRLAVVTARDDLQPHHLLFVELGELEAGTVDADAARERATRYAAGRSYLARHGIQPSRPRTLMEQM